MNLLGRKKSTSENGTVSAASASSSPPDETDVTSAAQAGKGRPTPKRDAGKRRGPIAPAPLTSSEARQRRKSLRGPKLSRAERKVENAERRSRVADNREKMMAGDEAYLLPRDKGPVRAFARDIVDSRRNVLGLFMPLALFLIFSMFAVPSVQVQMWMTPAMLVLMIVMIVDGVFVGRLVNKRVFERFPTSDEGGFKLGWYAASRASQLRKMRAPRPRVNRGEPV
ncbi:DUF3043 domain-containing protein [Mycobacteroides salmoniphilum]|uniref:DUF3043 domain-containing protein n=1 Tax=Mycobacteroides salmoniphilum TaxID=404941 RepID=A0A4R8SUB1_9MYCO|nr:DUF3043 domain-containing protein [Mycobacteroides salmoniphilum]TEA04062.1 hypothetical protein CCUG60884_02925 [Mycobacteroides salmoniphilum]